MIPIQIRFDGTTETLDLTLAPSLTAATILPFSAAFIHQHQDGTLELYNPTEEFACHSASCRPPTSGGTGGSTGKGHNSPTGGDQEIAVGVGKKGKEAPSPGVADMSPEARTKALEVIHTIPGMEHVQTVEEAVGKVESRLNALITLATTHDLKHGNPDDDSATGPYDSDRVAATGRWYDIANHYTAAVAGEYGFAHAETGAAVYAALSPGARWPSNVTNGNVVMKHVAQNTELGESGIKDLHYRMVNDIKSKLSTVKDKKKPDEWKTAETERLNKLLTDVDSPEFGTKLAKQYGKTKFNDLPDDVAANVVMGHIQRHALKEQNITPSADGSYTVTEGTRKAIIQSVPNFVSAIRMARADQQGLTGDALRTVIDENVSRFSKVRSFYMNIAYPNNHQNSVTLDTHAFAGLTGQPLSLDNSGRFFSQTKEVGYANTYPIMREAMSRVKPRLQSLGLNVDRNSGVQSVTWEMTRALLPQKGKGSIIKAGSAPGSVWDNANELYRKGDDLGALTLLAKASGGID